jgi:hypothetical protein
LPWRLPLLVACVAASAANAQEPAATEPNWLDGVKSRCEQQYSAEQCGDEQFLNEKFNVESLQTAHKAAIRHHDLEERALRELLLQRACNNKAAYCATSATVGCKQQLAQMCAAIVQQATTCLSQARQYCATFPQNADCLGQRQAQCPSAKKQSTDALLAKYPKLSAQQQAHVRQLAQQIDANLNTSWVGDLFRWLGFSS